MCDCTFWFTVEDTICLKTRQWKGYPKVAGEVQETLEAIAVHKYQVQIHVYRKCSVVTRVDCCIATFSCWRHCEVIVCKLLPGAHNEEGAYNVYTWTTYESNYLSAWEVRNILAMGLSHMKPDHMMLHTVASTSTTKGLSYLPTCHLKTWFIGCCYGLDAPALLWAPGITHSLWMIELIVLTVCEGGT